MTVQMEIDEKLLDALKVVKEHCSKCFDCDECPMAYKNMDDIVKNITPTAEIVNIIKPIYNFKAGETADLRGKRR